MDIEAVIAQATTQAAPESKAPEMEAKTETAPTQEAEGKENSPNLENKPDSELTAEQLEKREANRQSHLNSKLAKMRRENRELKERIDAVSKNQATTAASPQLETAPKEEDFDSYGDYLRADARWAAKQELAERDTKTKEAAIETAKTHAVNAQKVERINEVANQEQEFAKTNPEYNALYKEHGDFMDNLPLQIAEALMEAENAPLALFALMKEGKLEGLEDMSPYKISMEIGKAELRGQSYLTQQNKATNAPTPIQAARGTTSASKSLENKSVEELMKQFNSR